jgi:hypothetical protein
MTLRMSSGPAHVGASAAFPGGIISAWYRWVAPLPPPWRVVAFVAAAWIALYLVLRYGAKPLAAVGGWLAGSFLHVATWIAVTPEFTVTSIANHYWDRNPPGSFAYGEAVAGLGEAGERGVTRVSAFLRRPRNSSGKVAFFSVVVVLVLVNLAAYHGHEVLPAARWWHSLTAWWNSLHHKPGQHVQAPPTPRHRHHHHRHHRS